MLEPRDATALPALCPHHRCHAGQNPLDPGGDRAAACQQGYSPNAVLYQNKEQERYRLFTVPTHAAPSTWGSPLRKWYPPCGKP